MRMNEPIFVVGVPRSGTTLLRVMLDSHPNIACGPEFPLLTENVSRIWGRDWPCTESFSKGIPLKVFENFGFSESDVHSFCSTFIDTIFSEYARRKKKARWAIKVPRTVEKIYYLSQLFPDAFFIHCIRDGRDVVASSMAQRQKRPDWYPGADLEDFARDWVRMIGSARSDGDGVHHYLELHYEELIREPEVILSKIISFIGETWEDSLLRYHSLQHDFSARELSTNDVQKPLYSEAVGSWRSRLSEYEMDRIMEVEGFKGLLETEGYL